MFKLFFLSFLLIACQKPTTNSGEKSPDQELVEEDEAEINDSASEEEDSGEALMEKKIQIPRPNVFMDKLPFGEVIQFRVDLQNVTIYTSTSLDLSKVIPDEWQDISELTLDKKGKIKIFAVAKDDEGNSSEVFSEVVEVVESYLPAATKEGSDAIDMDDVRIKGWASNYLEYNVGEDCDAKWQTPKKSLNKAEGDFFNVVSLGNGGSITLTFDSLVVDKDGFDFAVFENSMSDIFLELAFVEVSSDGENFVRFDTSTFRKTPVGAFDLLEPEDLYGFAGRYKRGFGTPFDLSWLKYKEQVVNGKVDLKKISYIRIVDIWGNPDSGVIENDSFGYPIYDPYRTRSSAGFDLDAIGVLNISE